MNHRFDLALMVPVAITMLALGCSQAFASGRARTAGTRSTMRRPRCASRRRTCSAGTSIVPHQCRHPRRRRDAARTSERHPPGARRRDSKNADGVTNVRDELRVAAGGDGPENAEKTSARRCMTPRYRSVKMSLAFERGVKASRSPCTPTAAR